MTQYIDHPDAAFIIKAVVALRYGDGQTVTFDVVRPFDTTFSVTPDDDGNPMTVIQFVAPDVLVDRYHGQA